MSAFASGLSPGAPSPFSPRRGRASCGPSPHTWDQIFQTPFWTIFKVKMVLFTAMLLASAPHDFVLGPLQRQAGAAARPPACPSRLVARPLDPSLESRRPARRREADAVIWIDQLGDRGKLLLSTQHSAVSIQPRRSGLLYCALADC